MAAFGAVLVCDDVRRDTNNKDIIIGIYSADIVVSTAPAWLTLALYLEYLPSELGEQEVELRFGMVASGLVGANLKLKAEALTPIAIPITGLQMIVEKETELLIEASFDKQNTWQELKRKNVKVGPLPAASPMPTFLDSLPGNS